MHELAKTDDLLSRNEAAKSLGVSVSTIINCIRRGHLSHQMVNGVKKYSKADLVAARSIRSKRRGGAKPSQATLCMKKLQAAPHTPEGDYSFLEEVRAVPTIGRPLLSLLKSEAPKRPAIYEELERIILREEVKFL